MIISFSLPAFRTIRFSIRNSRAQNALAKLGEARLSFYASTKGWDIQTGWDSGFTGEDAKAWMENESTNKCVSPALIGIPGAVFREYSSETIGAPVSQLFACGFLDWRDFVDIPYTFYICQLYVEISHTGEGSEEGSEEESEEESEAGSLPPACRAAGVLASAAADGEDAAKTAGAKYVYVDDNKGYWMIFPRSTRTVATSEHRLTQEEEPPTP